MPIPIDSPGAYAQRLLDRLGDREPMAVLAASPGSLRSLFDGVDDATIRRPEKPGKWSMIHVAQHLADGEMVTGFRIRMIVAHDQPPIAAYDQDLWANHLHYDASDRAGVLEQFTAMREANLRLAARLSPAELARYGVHSERGGESVTYMLRLLAGHDLVHLDQVERIRRSHSS